MDGSGAARRYVIRVLGEDCEFLCRDDESVLNAMFRAGRGPLRYGCCGGACGICRMRVERGEIFAAKRMSREHVSETDQESGIVLLCCVQPRADLLLARV
jgi:ferredoxin